MLKTTRWNIIYEVGNCFVMVDDIAKFPRFLHLYTVEPIERDLTTALSFRFRLSCNMQGGGNQFTT